MRRLLGIDLGTRRIGLALADLDALRAVPLATVARGRTPAADAAAIARIAAANGVGELVVGLPLDMSGIEGPAATAARTWAAEIGARTGLDVVLRDERLTSHVAEGRAGSARRGSSGGPPGRTRRNAQRARIDRIAAAVILEDELDARRAAVVPAAEPATTPTTPPPGLPGRDRGTPDGLPGREDE